MTRDKRGQGFVPGFLEAAARTSIQTEGNLPGGGELFDVDRLRNMERPPAQLELGACASCGARFFHLDGCATPEEVAHPCGRCGQAGAAGAAGLCQDCGEVADAEGPQCSLCGGELAELGRLGRLMHWRCRNCGMDFSHDEGE